MSSGKDESWFTKTYNSGVAAAGSAAGGVVDAAGKGVEGAGKGVGDTVNGYAKGTGDYVSDYGNGIKDWAGADGSRKSTANNPVALKDSKSGGKTVVTGSKATAGEQQTKQNPLGLSKP